MKTIKAIGNYFLMYSEIDKTYEIYSNENPLGFYDDLEEAEKDFEGLVGKGELLANEKND